MAILWNCNLNLPFTRSFETTQSIKTFKNLLEEESTLQQDVLWKFLDESNSASTLYKIDNNVCKQSNIYFINL